MLDLALAFLVFAIAVALLVWSWTRFVAYRERGRKVAGPEFLANVSHEIRTPMNAIIGMTHLAARTEPNPRTTRYLASIRTASDLMMHLLNDILDYSKVVAGRMEVDRAKFSVYELLDRVVDLFAAGCRDKGLKLYLDVDPALPQRMIGDSYRLQQVLVNLVSNAVKFTESGSITIRLHPNEKPAHGAEEIDLRFEVIDSGIGLTDKQVENIFDPFRQADSSTTRKYGGTGLGLTLAQSLVELMGGVIWVDSHEGRGSRFTVEIDFELPPHPGWLSAPGVLRDAEVMLAIDDAHEADLMAGYLAFLEVPLLPGGIDAMPILLERRARHSIVLADAHAQIEGAEVEAAGGRIIQLVGPGEFAETGGLGRKPILLESPASPASLLEALLEAVNWYRREHESTTLSVKSDRTLVDAHVLVAEDDELCRELAREILEEFACHVTVVENGEEVLEALNHGRYDCVLMDCGMPVKDGFDTTREVRQSYSPEKLPVIAMTASVTPQDRARCKEAGMNDFLAKPVDPQDLVAMVERYISDSTVEEYDSRRSSRRVMVVPDELMDLPGIDVTDGLKRVLGRVDVYRGLLQRFVEAHGDGHVEIQKALDDNDFAAAGSRAHALAGAAGSIGAGKLRNLAKQIEATAKDGRHPTADDLGAFREVLTTVKSSIRSHTEEQRDANRVT